MHIIIAVIFSEVHQHSCGTATISGSAEAAVADPSAGWALPLRVEQSIFNFLSVAVAQTGSTELTPHPDTLWITTVSFSVDGLLTALVASRSSGAVVDLLPHIGTDPLQLQLSDLLNRYHNMRDGFGPIESAATWLWFIIFFVEPTLADQAELVLRLLLGRWAGRSVHHRAGAGVWSR